MQCTNDHTSDHRHCFFFPQSILLIYHYFFSNNQVQAENYTQNNGQPTHGPGIAGGQASTPDLRHSANVTPIPAPVMGKHSSYNYRARNDGDPVVKVVFEVIFLA